MHTTDSQATTMTTTPPQPDGEPFLSRLQAGLGAPEENARTGGLLQNSTVSPASRLSVLSSSATSFAPPTPRVTADRQRSYDEVGASSRPMLEPSRSSRSTTSTQIAIESEAEEGFETHSPRFFRFPKLHRGSRRERHRDAPNVDSGREESPPPTDLPDLAVEGNVLPDTGSVTMDRATSSGTATPSGSRRRAGVGVRRRNTLDAEDHGGNDQSASSSRPANTRSRAGSMHTVHGDGDSNSLGLGNTASNLISQIGTRSRSLLNHTFPRFNNNTGGPTTTSSPASSRTAPPSPSRTRRSIGDSRPRSHPQSRRQSDSDSISESDEEGDDDDDADADLRFHTHQRPSSSLPPSANTHSNNSLRLDTSFPSTTDNGSPSSRLQPLRPPSGRRYDTWSSSESEGEDDPAFSATVTGGTDEEDDDDEQGGGSTIAGSAVEGANEFT